MRTPLEDRNPFWAGVAGAVQEVWEAQRVSERPDSGRNLLDHRGTAQCSPYGPPVPGVSWPQSGLGLEVRVYGTAPHRRANFVWLAERDEPGDVRTAFDLAGKDWL